MAKSVWPNKSTVGVALTLLVCLFLMLKSSEDKLTSTLRSPGYGDWFQRFTDGNQIIFNLAVGMIASLLTYIATVIIPQNRKRARLRRQLLMCYVDFKRECLHTILSTLTEKFDSAIVEQLIDKEECRRFFGVNVSEGQSRWHQFLNGISELQMNRFHFELEKLTTEIDFTMLTIDVENEELFEFLKRLKHVCRYRTTQLTKDYDDVKALSKFLWEILGGWNFIDGYKQAEKIETMIASI
jgi:hypothetical protein